MVTGFLPAYDKSKPRLTVGFFGLWGPNGPLPLHLTDYAYERLRHAGDATLARFADIFHHRLLLLFHRAWAKSQPTVSMDRPAQDEFAFYVGALMGLGLEATRNRGWTHDFTKFYYAPWFGSSSRHADGLRAIVEDHFGLPVQIEQFAGEWLDVPDDDRWRLGGPPHTSSLGRAVLGGRVWSTSHKFRLVLGPLTRAHVELVMPRSGPVDERSGLPRSGAIDELSGLVRLYTNDQWAWEIRLVLDPSASVPMRLGGQQPLGWTTRIGSASGVGFDLIVDPSTRRTRRVSRSRTPSFSGERI